MTAARSHRLNELFRKVYRYVVVPGLFLAMSGMGSAQDASGKAPDAAANGQMATKAQDATAKADSSVVGDYDQPAPALPKATTVAERSSAAWTLLTDAASDAKKPQTRIQALAALSMLRTPRSEKMIADAMMDQDVDVRVAAALAAGQTKDRNLTTNLRNLLDDKEPEVAFTAAMTLWKMGDKSGEDVLMSIVDGGTGTGPTLLHGTGHKINKDLHDPAMLAKMAAMQGATMMLGPFGYGIAAFEFIHQNGGNLARASAIEQIGQERTDPIHKELVNALNEKDPVVRAAAAKALVQYQDKPTSMAVYALLADNKQPVRLTAAAAYLRTTGTPGPPVAESARAPKIGK